MSHLSGPPDEILVKLAGGHKGEVSSFLPIRVYSAFRTEEERNDIVFAVIPIFAKVHYMCS